MNIKGIIFDVDGVIFDSEKLHRKAWKQVFGKRGIFLKDKKSGVGYSDKEFLKELKEKGVIPQEIDIQEIQDEKLDVLVSLAERKVDFFPNVQELIVHLKKDYLLCVASNSDIKFISKILKNANLIPYFLSEIEATQSR